MQPQLIKSTLFFQQLLSSRFRTLKERVVKTIMLLSLCHLFGLYNPNQVSDALFIPKASLYRHLNEVSLYQWQHLFVHIGCSVALQEIRDAELKSASTRSRKCITISVDDTHNARDAKKVSYCYNWWSTKANQPVKGQNILGITIKIGKINIPLNMCLVSKQGRGNTDKPSCFVSMLKEILDFFDAEGVDLRKYPITFDSWYGSRKLIDTLRKMGFETILIHAKNNYVMTIGKEKAKLSEHKKSIQLLPNQWGCNKPVCRTKGSSRTFGDVVLLFFQDGGKIQTMMVFGKPLRACEILRIWSQHHGIEQFWAEYACGILHDLKTDLKLSSMSLEGRHGAYANLGVKVMSYLLIQQVSRSGRKTFHQTQLELTGQRQMLSVLSEHFHDEWTRKY